MILAAQLLGFRDQLFHYNAEHGAPGKAQRTSQKPSGEAADEGAQKRAYELVDQIHFDGMQCRRDIGYRAVGRKG